MALDFEILGHGIYSPRQAARLIGSTPQEVMRWTRGTGPREPLWNAYYQVLDDTTELSFLDLIEIRVVKAMRKAGIPMQTIRFAIDFATRKLGVDRPLSSRRFRTEGKAILMDAVEGDGQLVSLSRANAGQKVFTEIVEQSLGDLEYEGSTVARWRPRISEGIVVDPQRSFGSPILDDFGVSTEILRGEVELHGSADYVARLYEMPPRLVRSAVRFESELDRQFENVNGQSPA